MYLLDANVLITAHNNYYAIDQVPEYWGWLVDQAARSFIKMPIEIIEEVKAGRKKEVKNDKIQKDLLYDWIEKHAQKFCWTNKLIQVWSGGSSLKATPTT